MLIGPPIPEIQHFKIWPWKSKVKVIAQGHKIGITPYRLVSLSFHWCRSAIPFLGYSYFKIWHWKVKVKVMGEVKVESHNMGPTFNIQSTHTLFVPRQSGIPFPSYDFCKIWPWKSRVKVMGEVTIQSHYGSTILSTPILFVPCQSTLSFLRYSIIQIWPWKSRVKVKWPWCCRTTGLDNSIRLRMV